MEEVTSNYEKRRGQIRSAVFVAFFYPYGEKKENSGTNV
jgi:hypothetical protein